MTTWEGLVERNMDAQNTRRMYCLAKSMDEARIELERLCRKEYPDTYYVEITDVRVSK